MKVIGDIDKSSFNGAMEMEASLEWGRRNGRKDLGDSNPDNLFKEF